MTVQVSGSVDGDFHDPIGIGWEDVETVVQAEELAVFVSALVTVQLGWQRV